jgi:adenylosuccinate synthase
VEASAAMLDELGALKERGLVEALVEGYARFWAAGARVAGEGHLARLAARGALVFEGAQGALLDRDHGFWPHVTPTRTTFHNALALLEEAGLGGAPREQVGVFRAYASRHGAGPFVTEDEGLLQRLPEPHNAHGPWQGAFRVGWFDLVAARYALEACGGADSLSLTCLDRLDGFEELRVCEAYECEAAPDELDGLVAWSRPDATGATARISALLPQPPADYERLGRLTALLRRCRPVYGGALPGWSKARRGPGALDPAARGFVARLEERLGVRVGLVSTGPRASDKLALA